jgi:hypothetical protein
MAAGIDPTFYRSPAEATAAPAERLVDAAADDPAVRDRDARTPAATPADMHPIVAHHAGEDSFLNLLFPGGTWLPVAAAVGRARLAAARTWLARSRNRGAS